MRKLIGMMIVLFICFVMAAGSAFAWPPVDKASKNQACGNASTEGKANANGNSVLGSCGNDDPASAADEQVEQEEEETTDTASTDDTTTTVDCSSPDAMILPECS